MKHIRKFCIIYIYQYRSFNDQSSVSDKTLKRGNLKKYSNIIFRSDKENLKLIAHLQEMMIKYPNYPSNGKIKKLIEDKNYKELIKFEERYNVLCSY